jgi:hypothetical protein
MQARYVCTEILVHQAKQRRTYVPVQGTRCQINNHQKKAEANLIEHSCDGLGVHQSNIRRHTSLSLQLGILSEF